MGSLAAEVVEDCFGVLQVYSDGSIYRASESDIEFGDHCSKNNSNEDEDEIEWEDCLFDEKNELYLRVYDPKIESGSKLLGGRRIPIVYYFHGGGFCLGSRTWPNCHHCCLHLSSQLQSIVIAPDYRLAPEHRLPAAIEDGLNAMKWLQLQAKTREYNNNNNSNNNNNNNTLSRLLDNEWVDFDQVYIIGDSSGGNIAHHLAINFGSGSSHIHPVRVRGYVLLAPFFGGSLRTNSEAAPSLEPLLNLDTLDRFWRLSLPEGESRDHPLANPFGPSSPNLETASLDPILVIVGGNEIMKDRIEDYAKRLKALGKDVTYVKIEGQHHGFLTENPFSEVSQQVLQHVKQFMSSWETSC